MHGRKQVQRTAEEESKKQKERHTKVTAYQYAMRKIFDKRSKGELDDELLSICGQVLASNPDIATLWNIKKETLIQMKQADLSNFTDNVVPKELDFAQFCLKSNPKSYGAWYHRYWLMRQTDFKRVAEELKLCSKYLEYDDRNFHCWDYRRFLLDNCKLVTLDQELEFTTEKISSNFSNFSSWHLRSKLLPRLSKDFLNDELELIRNAVFTDPKDQSAWLYHLWLLKSQIQKVPHKLEYLHLTEIQLIVCFNVPVSNPNEVGLKSSLNSGAWTNPWNISRSKLWSLDVQASHWDPTTNIIMTGEPIFQLLNKDSISLKLGTKYNYFPKYFDEETKPKSSELEKLLREELTWVMELHDLEPDIQWPLHTGITLMRLINYIEFKSSILEFLEKLVKIDPKRINYYNDLRSKFTAEWIFATKCGSNDVEIDLTGLQLTALYYPERLCYMQNIDCSNNQLKNCVSLSAFTLCQELNLSNNQIQDSSNLLQAIQNLGNLKTLGLSGNPVFDSGDFSNASSTSLGSIKVL